MIGLRAAGRRLVQPRTATVSSVRTHMHFTFHADEAPQELGPAVKLNMCNAIKDAIGQVIHFF